MALAGRLIGGARYERGGCGRERGWPVKNGPDLALGGGGMRSGPGSLVKSNFFLPSDFLKHLLDIAPFCPYYR